MIFNRIEKKYNGRAVIFHQVLFKPIRITLQESYAIQGQHRPPPALSEKKPRQEALAGQVISNVGLPISK